MWWIPSVIWGMIAVSVLFFSERPELAFFPFTLSILYAILATLDDIKRELKRDKE